MTGSSWEIDVIIWCQQFGDWLLPIMTLVTRLGYGPFYAMLIPAVYWCVDRKLGLRIAVFVLFSSSLNAIVKLALHAPRPYWADSRIHALYHPSTEFGMPSGHAQTSSNVWLLLAHSSKKTWGWPLAGALFVLIGLSRLYLGAHFLSQVLSGWCLGALLVIAFVKLEGKIIRWMRTQSLWRQLLLTGGVCMSLMAAGEICVLLLANFNVPPEWQQNMARYLGKQPFEPVTATSIAAYSGALLGFLWGGILLAHGPGFRAGGLWWKRMLRYWVGMIALAVLGSLGLAVMSIILFSDTWIWLEDGMLFLGAGILGLAVIYLIPLLFVRLKLAEPAVRF